MERMVEREERRQSALRRAAEEEGQREKLLIDHGLQKESATLRRIIELEKNKVHAIREHQNNQFIHMEQARRRRELQERERQAKLERIRKRREERLTFCDPYARYVARTRNVGLATPAVAQGK
ncbi:hypothetical protein TRSC58_03027 [Trypanosoma rangeli SC58]|uniref:Uncharacterized protein n=1 Tax=Trypanosoma rangeli SC58 TaxID=429131 RepID=A0A061J554_TRYRA|nr:hypothetical protein TRSC58_03027 [Trypanosoma rangeli SC58]